MLFEVAPNQVVPDRQNLVDKLFPLLNGPKPTRSCLPDIVCQDTLLKLRHKPRVYMMVAS
jgi:hypothetical protein